MAGKAPLKISTNSPALTKALQVIADELARVDSVASREVVTGVGLVSPHSDESTIILETESTGLSGGSGSCSIWAISPASATSVFITCGTVGGVLPSNHNAEFTLPEGGVPFFIVATCALVNGGVTGCTLSLEEAPTLDAGPVTAGAPPSSIDILIGAGRNFKACFAFDGNVTISPYQAWRQASGTGPIPYTIYWGLNVSG